MSKEWIQTYTNKHFYPFDPNPDDICIEDIAHSLSLQCRFTGHSKVFYSVAQHSVLVSELSGPHVLWGLLHDASEAYLTDVARPVKHSAAFATYRYAESIIMKAICKRFELPEAMPPIVHEADEIALISEARVLMGDISAWQIHNSHQIVNVSPVEWKVAEHMFINKFQEVYEQPKVRLGA